MAKFITIKDHYRESLYFANRLHYLVAIVFFLSGLLIVRLYDLQVAQYDYHATLSEKNRIRIEPLAPTRGLIVDAKGRLLAENRPSFSVSIIDARRDQLEQTVDQIAQWIAITPDERDKFLERAQWSRRPGQLIPLRLNLTEAEVARLAVNQHVVPGMRVSADLVRYYPYHELTAHVVGYVGRINQRDEARIDAASYAGTHYIGKTGLEKYYEDLLLGQVGHQTIEANARGRVLRVMEQTLPQPGQDIQLYLDIDLQRRAYEVLGTHSAALVAIELPSGGVKALVSTPGFDPNQFVQGISHSEYQLLRDSESRPLFNRAVRGQYPPGSTLKPFVALAGLEHDKANWYERIDDPGFYQVEGEKRRYRDWKRSGHGRIGLFESLVQSCDTYFYQMSHQLGVDAMSTFLRAFGFGQSTGIDLPGETASLLPTRTWKRDRYQIGWFPGDTLNMSIGQGFMLATPIQLAVATAQLVNRGKPILPQLLMAPSQGEGSPSVPTLQIKNPDDWQPVLDSMEAVVHSSTGTARRIAQGATYLMAGKTGTSQVKGIKQEEEYDETKLARKHWDHALFIGYAPAEEPRLVVALIVENGGSGGATAAPIFRELMDAYFELSEGS